MKRPLFPWQKSAKLMLRRYPQYAHLPQAVVSIRYQCIYLIKNLCLIAAYPVSTSRFGTGLVLNSYRTPVGLHYVAAKIGDGVPLMTRFVGRVERGTAIVNPLATISEEDAICTRILWLVGLEYKVNQGKFIGTMQRYIYIHGTIDEKRIGRVASCGCVRMNNTDVCKVFDILPAHSLVYILK